MINDDSVAFNYLVQVIVLSLFWPWARERWPCNGTIIGSSISPQLDIIGWTFLEREQDKDGSKFSPYT